MNPLLKSEKHGQKTNDRHRQKKNTQDKDTKNFQEREREVTTRKFYRPSEEFITSGIKCKCRVGLVSKGRQDCIEQDL